MAVSNPPSFIIDNMLRGLARWLRFMGFRSWVVEDFNELPFLTRRERDAIFITASSSHLQNLPDSKELVLHATTIAQQLQELQKHFNIFNRINLLSICSICNTPLSAVDPDAVKMRVPESINKSNREFWQCSHCQRVYWHGGHITRLLDKMRRMGIPIP